MLVGHAHDGTVIRCVRPRTPIRVGCTPHTYTSIRSTSLRHVEICLPLCPITEISFIYSPCIPLINPPTIDGTVEHPFITQKLHIYFIVRLSSYHFPLFSLLNIQYEINFRRVNTLCVMASKRKFYKLRVTKCIILKVFLIF